MRILHIFHHSNLINGVDRTTLTLLRALRQIGMDVSALVPQIGDVTQALDGLGVEYRVLDLPCCTGPAKMAELRYLSRAATRAGEIEDWLRAERFDLVHLNTGHLLDGALAAAKAGVASIWHIHAPFEIDLARYSGFMEKNGYAWLLAELGSHVIAVSDDVRNSLLPHMPGSKVSTLFNGIDVADLDERARQMRIPLRDELGLSQGAPIVLGVGRISAQKDFATFVRVARQVMASHPTACFAIVGPDEDRVLADALRKQVAELDLGDRVFILGARNDVPALLAQCDAFLSTAIFEGQGLAALEAMSLNKPVIAMDCIGLRECIQSEVDGLLVPLGDESTCASAVLRVLADKALAAELGARGRQTVEARYSAAAYARGFLDIAKRAQSSHHAGTNTSAASFALGLLKEVREAHDRLVKATPTRKSLVTRLRGALAISFKKN